MIGFLTPEGEFVKCKSWEHTRQAMGICIFKYNKDFYSGQDAEDYLLSLGYLVLRARDAYMSYKHNDRWITLTDAQLTWLSANAEELNENQKEYINEILHDQDDIRKRPLS